MGDGEGDGDWQFWYWVTEWRGEQVAAKGVVEHRTWRIGRKLTAHRNSSAHVLFCELTIEQDCYPSWHDALTNNNVHDSNRLQNHTPRNPFRHVKQQHEHHSIIRPSHQAKQHAQEQTTQQTTQQTRRPHCRHVPDKKNCRENHVVKRFFVLICPSPSFRLLMFYSKSRTYIWGIFLRVL